MTANFPHLLDPNDSLNLTITVVIFAWATVMVWRGALLGARGHAKPRLFVAVALTAGTLLNLAALFDAINPETRASLSRGITWVLVLALGWTAITGVRYGKKVERAFTAMNEIIPPEEPPDDAN